VTENPDEADYALVFIASPIGHGGYERGCQKGRWQRIFTGILTIRQIHRRNCPRNQPCRWRSFRKFTNRSYKGKSETSTNVTDLAMVNDTYAKMKGKPVIVSVNMNNPMVFAELEKQANAIIADFGVQGQASLDILTGKAEPSALLPCKCHWI
jgi:beta-glucosidase